MGHRHDFPVGEGPNTFVLGGGLFATTAELSPGENKFILRARDLAGNTTEIERTVTLIGQAPKLTFVSPQNGHTFKHSPIPVTVTAESTDGTMIQAACESLPAKSRPFL